LIKKQETDKQGQELLRRRTGDCFLGAIWYMFGRGPYDEIVNFFYPSMERVSLKLFYLGPNGMQSPVSVIEEVLG
jgi:hypothetical protein